MRAILGIDPGTHESGFAFVQHGIVVLSGIEDNYQILRRLHDMHPGYQVVIEMIASYGMPVGAEVFETCVWIGRFTEAFSGDVTQIYRRDVKLHLCGTARAKDGNIRQALIDKLGPQGTKAKPGPTYGVKSHAWAALAVAVTYDETHTGIFGRQCGRN